MGRPGDHGARHPAGGDCGPAAGARPPDRPRCGADRGSAVEGRQAVSGLRRRRPVAHVVERRRARPRSRPCPSHAPRRRIPGLRPDVSPGHG
ncbi:MAG: hypothetical protein FJ148_15880 [Deltaproteobacteria bacterium]|nr:hypothetical protein [Deltaproteobacteria bacterium]